MHGDIDNRTFPVGFSRWFCLDFSFEIAVQINRSWEQE